MIKQKQQKKNKKIIIVLIILLLLIFSIYISFSSKDYYKIKPRIEKVNGIFEGENYTYEKVGWIQIQGTSIDLPIFYSKEVLYPVELEGYAKMIKYYPGFHNHLEVSGHNIFNLSPRPKIDSNDFKRFEALMAFVYYDFAKDNKYIQLSYNKNEYLYKIFMVGFIPKLAMALLPFNIDYTEDEMQEFLETIEKYNIYKYDINVSTKDKVLVLSTCTRFFGEDTDSEFFVIGRLIREDEKINNYSIKKADKYSEVEKILKGSEENEEI